VNYYVFANPVFGKKLKVMQIVAVFIHLDLVDSGIDQRVQIKALWIQQYV